MERPIKSINNKQHKKELLVLMINEAISEVNQIHELYNKLVVGVDDKAPILQEIESLLNKVEEKYAGFFNTQEDGSSKIESFNKAIDDVRSFHENLMSADGIKIGIETMQLEIRKFYLKLFQSNEASGDGGQSKKLSDAINIIVDFSNRLTEDDGYKSKVENAKNEILSMHNDIFEPDPSTGTSKAATLQSQITEVDNFHEKINKQIKPSIDKSLQDIAGINEDITNKRKEIDTLLSSASIGTLSEGYIEAMQLYGSPRYGKPTGNFWGHVGFIAVVCVKWLAHSVKLIGSYLLFIGPLIAAGIIFVGDNNNLIKTVPEGVTFSGAEYIAYKLTIALPLLWVSWFGQKSISHKKRLFEEYNHKLRIIHIYFLFITKPDTYKLQSIDLLEAHLIKAIKKNPVEVYNKDETLLDKLIAVLKEFRSGPASKDEKESE